MRRAARSQRTGQLLAKSIFRVLPRFSPISGGNPARDRYQTSTRAQQLNDQNDNDSDIARTILLTTSAARALQTWQSRLSLLSRAHTSKCHPAFRRLTRWYQSTVPFHQIIPRATDWFTGEALQFEDFEEDTRKATLRMKMVRKMMRSRTMRMRMSLMMGEENDS